MRVLLISANAAFMQCGIGDYTSRLANMLAQQGCEVEYATLAPRPPQENGPAHNPIHWRDIPRWDWQNVRALVERVAADPPDLIHLQYPAKAFRRSIPVMLMPYLFRARVKRPFVLTLHVFRKMVTYKKPPFWIIMAGADHLVVTAPSEKKHLELYRWDARASVIPIGSNFFKPPPEALAHTNRAELRRLLKLPQDAFILCNLGFLERNKRLETILQTAHLLREKIPLHVLFIGPFAPDKVAYHAELQRWVAQHQLKEQVHWSGYRADSQVPAWLKASDAAVLLYPDGISWQRTALLAAMEAGLPVIANTGDGLPDDLRDRENIILLERIAPDEMVNAVQSLYRAPELAKKIAAQGQALVQTRPGWDEIARMHLALYQELTAARAPINVTRASVS